MFKNYLVVILRNLYKNKVFALINILGLGIALALCIVAYFNHMFEAGWDGQHVNRTKIYKINIFRDMQARNQEYGISPMTLGLEIKKDISGLENVVRYMRSYSPVKVEHEIFNKRVAYVDPDFLDMFTFPLISGSKGILEEKGSVLISEQLAGILFGDQDPVGKIITIYNDSEKAFTYMVQGVFENLPLNSSFRIDIMTRFDNFVDMWGLDETNWQYWVAATFIQVPDPSHVDRVKEMLRKYIPVQNEAREDFKITDFRIIPLKKVGKNNRDVWSNWLINSMHPAAIVAPPIMAILILLIASFNFTNTAIASAGKRLKEIGIRKVVGGQKRQLVVQFLMENLIVCFFALIVALAIAKFLVPAYSSMWEYMSIELSFTEHKGFWLFLVLLLLLTGFLAGSYPAFYISSFRPVGILQGKMKLGGANVFTRILLTLQFGISVLALVSGILFTQNATYQATLDLGYDRDKVIIVPIINGSNFNPLKEEAIKHPKIISIGGTQEHIGFGNYRRTVKYKENEIEVDVLDIGQGYIETMGLRLLEGRKFDPSREEADRQGSIIVNRKMVRDFGWSDAIGQEVWMYDTIKLTVIGVVDDFYTQGVWQAINPTMLGLADREKYYNMVVRGLPEVLPEINASLRETWQSLVPNYPYAGRLQEETMAEAKGINKGIKDVQIFLALIATLLSLIGMYTLVSLSIINRTKEVGIRKVLGASIVGIMNNINRNFIYILLIAAILGCVGGYYMSEMLMGSIWDHYLDINPVIFVYPVIFIFLISFITTGSKVYQAATRNPADSLRYE